jgi:hypothetical protein
MMIKLSTRIKKNLTPISWSQLKKEKKLNLTSFRGFPAIARLFCRQRKIQIGSWNHSLCAGADQAI